MWMNARPGRLAVGVTSRSLPEIHVETGNPPKPPLELPPNPAGLGAVTDQLWDLRNTWPIMRLDIRWPRLESPPAPLSQEGDENPFASDRLSSDQTGNALATMVSATVRRFGARFASNLKPFQYAIMIVGVDTTRETVSNATVLSRHTLDGYVWVNPPAVSNQSILYRPNGIQSCVDFFAGTMLTTGAFESMHAQLTTNSLPYPDFLLGDIESRGDIPATGPYGVTNGFWAGFPTPGNGFIESADLGQKLTRAITTEAWLTSRDKTQSGAALDPFAPQVTTTPPSRSPHDPVNIEALMLAFAAVTANFVDAMSESIFEPFQAVFGATKLCGEWDVYCATQNHQTPLLPKARQHFLGNDLSVSMQIPKNYSDLPSVRTDVNSLYSENINWDSVWNWLQVYQPAGYTLWTSYPLTPSPDPSSEVVQRVVLASQTQIVRAAARAAPSKQIMPSIGVGWTQSPDEPAGTQNLRMERSRPFMVRYMLNCCENGTRRFWLFAPDWNDGSVAVYNFAGQVIQSPVPGQLIRDNNYQLIKQFNGAYQARVPLRNRMWRHMA